MRDMQENHAGTCRKTLLILAGMDITTFVPVQACRTITAGLHECILFVTRAGPTTLFRPILKKGAPNKTVLKKKKILWT